MCPLRFFSRLPRSRHDDPFGKPVPQDSVLELEALDVLHQFLLGCPGNQHQQGVNEPWHLLIIRKSVSILEMTYYWDPRYAGRAAARSSARPSATVISRTLADRCGPQPTQRRWQTPVDVFMAKGGNRRRGV